MHGMHPQHRGRVAFVRPYCSWLPAPAADPPPHTHTPLLKRLPGLTWSARARPPPPPPSRAASSPCPRTAARTGHSAATACVPQDQCCTNGEASRYHCVRGGHGAPNIQSGARQGKVWMGRGAADCHCRAGSCDSVAGSDHAHACATLVAVRMHACYAHRTCWLARAPRAGRTARRIPPPLTGQCPTGSNTYTWACTSSIMDAAELGAAS